MGKTYEEIAAHANYTGDYLSKDIGNKLWRKMSVIFEETISKKNFRGAIERAWTVLQGASIQQELSPLHPTVKDGDPHFPEGILSLESPFYLTRDGEESLCTEAIKKPGVLIRIKAPKFMGKSSLVNRILAKAKQSGDDAVYIDIGTVEYKIRQDLDKLLRWFCLMVTHELGFENRVAEHWDTEILGSNDNCSLYFEESILPNLSQSLTIGLDNIDRIFEFGQVVEDFLGMLRSWHEKGKIYPKWSKIKLILSHSTECYIPLDLNQSPFNAGIPIELKPFSVQQVQQLVELYELPLPSSQLDRLKRVLGGHPYLVQLALYHAKIRQMDLNDILEKSATEESIYGNHLRRHLLSLKASPELSDALKTLVSSDQPSHLDSVLVYKLHSMGLIQEQGNHVVPSCQLYRDFFRRVL